MNSRPKPGESEEEILKQQEEFLKLKAANKIKPSVVIETTEKENTIKNDEQNTEEDIQAQLSNTFEAIPTNIKIGGIVEKITNPNKVMEFNFSREVGFPRAKRRDCTTSHKKGSIFAQQMKKLKKDESGPSQEDAMEIDDSNTTRDKVIINLPTESYILSGRDKDQIHKQNVELLKTMSEKEIIEEKEKLIATLDPAIVAFLKSKRADVSPQTSLTTISELNEAGRNVNIEEIEASSELLKQPEADKWIHFDSVETSKLAWMKDVTPPKQQQGENYEARFDFSGWLLPFSQPEINESNRILYHHGEEPGRPGYTLQELFQLARSSVTQQKIIALNTIANILSLHTTGVYENVLDIPIEQIFFVVRVCLDDNAPSVLNAAIKALRNLFFYEIDETCLNSILGFGIGTVQPILAVDEDEDDNTVNDQQLVETNFVKCLARTDILIRIRYIINVVKPTTETVVYCLEILQRLVRDSRFIMTRLYNLDGLIKNIIEFFVPQVATVNKTDTPYGVPLIQAVKLLRLLSARSRFIATELVNKYKIMDSVASYLSNETFSINPAGLKLQTECLHLFSLLLQYNLALDYLSALKPIFLRLLNYHLQKTDQNNTTSYTIHGHTAALLILLAEAAKSNWNLISDYVPILTGLAVKKWFAQAGELTNFSCGKLQIISALFQCLTAILVYKTEIDTDELDNSVMYFIKSPGFAVITNNIKFGSNLLNNVNTFKSTANFKTIQSVAWETSEHTIPVLLTKSCLPFLSAFSCFLSTTEKLELKLHFLQHENIKNYLQLLKQSQKYYLTTNWFTKIESLFIMNVLIMSIAIQKLVDTSIFYELAVKSLNVFNIEQKNNIELVFKNIIFSTSFYPSDVLIKNLNISDDGGVFEASLSNLEEIVEVYTEVLGLKQKSMLFIDSRSIDIKLGNIVPIDWIYSPILIMYSQQQENKIQLSELQQNHLIKNCLRWIYIYEIYFPELAACINVTDRFCRISCVFLASDNLFLEPNIQKLLEKCLWLIIQKSGKDLNFNKPIQGLNNFQDFYTQLLEQYQGVSYGNTLFANVVLIPLAQRHNIKWRKTLWSEYAGVVQTLNLTPQQCVCTLEEFLYPPEDDLSLLKCYRRALVSGLVRKQSILYEIANHHVESFVAKKRDKNQ